MDHDLAKDLEERLIGKKLSELTFSDDETGDVIRLLKEEEYEI